MSKYGLKIYGREKSYNRLDGREIPHHTEDLHAADDAAAAREAQRLYDKFAAEVAAQKTTTDLRLDRGELYESERLICDSRSGWRI